MRFRVFCMQIFRFIFVLHVFWDEWGKALWRWCVTLASSSVNVYRQISKNESSGIWFAKWKCFSVHLMKSHMQHSDEGLPDKTHQALSKQRWNVEYWNIALYQNEKNFSSLINFRRLSWDNCFDIIMRVGFMSFVQDADADGPHLQMNKTASEAYPVFLQLIITFLVCTLCLLPRHGVT